WAKATGNPDPSFFDKLRADPYHALLPRGIMGAGLGLAGGTLGGMVGDQIFPPNDANQDTTTAANSNNPRLTPQAQQSIDDLVRKLTQFHGVPSNDVLQRYGTSSAPPFRFFG